MISWTVSIETNCSVTRETVGAGIKTPNGGKATFPLIFHQKRETQSLPKGTPNRIERNKRLRNTKKIWMINVTMLKKHVLGREVPNASNILIKDLHVGGL